MDIDDQDLTAYEALGNTRKNILVKNIKDAGLDQLYFKGTNAEDLLNKILKINADIKPDIKPGIRYASGSDFARVALVARGVQSLENSSQLPQQNLTKKNTMIYFDLDVPFKKTCGFLPLSHRYGDVYVNIYTEKAKVADGSIAHRPVNVLASKQANNENIMTMLHYIMNQYQELSHEGQLLSGESLPIAFDGCIENILTNNNSSLHRFPFLWDLPLHDGDNSWHETPNPLLSKKWKNVYKHYTSTI